MARAAERPPGMALPMLSRLEGQLGLDAFRAFRANCQYDNHKIQVKLLSGILAYLRVGLLLKSTAGPYYSR